MTVKGDREACFPFWILMQTAVSLNKKDMLYLETGFVLFSYKNGGTEKYASLVL